MRVVITGASGIIGRQLAEELSPLHELLLLDRRRVPGRNTVVADLSRTPRCSGLRGWLHSPRSRWSEVFAGADVVVHLAAEIRPAARWESVLSDNIQATWNVIQAAADKRVSRVVFASSNWAVKSLEQSLAPDCYVPNGPKISSDAPPTPITAYGLSKALGELMGRMLVDEGKLNSFVAVRIGSYHPDPPQDEQLRTRWIGPDDIRSILRRCVEAEFKGYHVVYGVSAQPTAPYELSHTRELLSWMPKQRP